MVPGHDYIIVPINFPPGSKIITVINKTDTTTSVTANDGAFLLSYQDFLEVGGWLVTSSNVAIRKSNNFFQEFDLLEICQLVPQTQATSWWKTIGIGIGIVVIVMAVIKFYIVG